MKSLKNMIAKVPALLLVGLFGLSLAPSVALAANTFNASPDDLATTYISNATRYPNSSSHWVTSETANPGDTISVEIYYHNNSASETARNTGVRLLVPSGPASSFQITGSVRADGFTGAASNVNLSLPSGQTLTYIPGSFKWWPTWAHPISNPIRIPPGGQPETALFSPEGMMIGDVIPDTFPGSFSGQGNIVVSFLVGGNVPPPNPPTLTLTATPTTVNSGQAATLSWSSTNATQCTASGDWIGARSLNGSESTGPLFTDRIYTMTCTGTGGSVTRTANVTVTQVQNPPTLSLTANPNNVLTGNPSTLSWSSTNATQCFASGDWSGNRALSGSEGTGALFSDRTYTMTCTGPGGSVTRTTTVTVTQVQNPPTLTLTASPSTVTSGQTATLSWSSTNATQCFASGDWSGNRALSGSEGTGALFSDRSYTMTCTGPGGSVTRSTYVTVITQINPPTLTLSVYPGVLNSGEAATLTWSSTNATECIAYGDWNGYKSTNGSQSTGALYSSRTYTLTCTGQGGSVTRSVNVIVNQPPTQNPAVITSLYASPSTVTSGQTSTLYWTSINATSCYLSGATINENVPVNGSRTTGSLFQTSTYTLTCTGQGGSDTRTTTVTVVPVVPPPTQNPPLVVTNGATNILTTSAVLNGFVNFGSCAAGTAWFEYGTTPSLGLQSTQVSPNVIQGDFSRLVTGLAPDTVYYFRAVAQNNCGRGVGSVLSFRTGAVLGTVTERVARVATSKSVQNITAGGAMSTNIQARICDTVRYTLTVENTGERNLTNVRVSDKLANLLEFVSASGGGVYTESNRTIRWTVSSLPMASTEVLTFDAVVGPCRIPANVENTASTGSDQTSTRVSNGTVITVVPLGVGTPNSVPNQPVPPATTVDDSSDDSKTQTAGVGFFGSFLPQTVIGWALLLLLLVIIILFAKKALEGRRSGDGATSHGAAAH